MPDGVRRRMYDPFFTTKFLGRGLGLSVVQGIVRTHRGAISVESAPGAGTKFQVALPISGGPVPTEPVGTAERRQVPPLPSGSIVLVVDDEDMIRSLAQSILELGGYRVVQAENGQQAVEMVRRLGDQLGLVLLDLSMPVMDGAEALARIRETRAELPVLLMSGYGAGAIMERTAGVRHVEHLRKPFSPDGLMDAVANFAGRSDR
jgi:CheY-like chemotaxis protein